MPTNTSESNADNTTAGYTTFDELEGFFLAGITDDMYLELTREETMEMLDEILIAALPHFEFPKKNLLNLDLGARSFNCTLDIEEMLILRNYMIYEWIGFQVATVDLIRQKYSGSDFKFTSQASHLKQLTTMRDTYKQEGFHLQRLYSRRELKAKSGMLGSTMWKLRGKGTERQ